MMMTKATRITLLVALLSYDGCHARIQLPPVPEMPWRKNKSRSHCMEQSKDTNSSPTVQDFWPPWPFNLLQEKIQRSLHTNDTPSSPSSTYPTSATTTSSSVSSPTPSSSLFSNNNRRRPRTVLSSAWTISERSVRIAVRNFQELGSHVWFHLPPAAPPLFVAMLVARTPSTVDAATTKAVLPWHNPFCRQCALTSVGLALLSWGHTQWYRQRRLTPLSLCAPDITTAVLPPALPPPVPPLDDDDHDALVLSAAVASSSGWEDFIPPRWRKYVQQQNSGQEDEDNEDDTAGTTAALNYKNWFQQWQRTRAYRQRERRHVRRQALYDELVAVQQRRGRPSPSPNGCAVITGASQGIGRAIAIELARWKVAPLLVLVARNGPALADVAAEIEACYGVPCAILVADLSQRDAAQRVYDTIRVQAQLPVDILVNNAGIAAHGAVVDQSKAEIDRVLQVNTLSLLHLTHLMAQDMKRQRRGRVLMVSSVCGAISGIASVAVYSATKAFENSFGVALGKELEPYGVGVTCLLPGAVRGTEFRERSDSASALCWKLPFYSKTAATVAECGVRAMLLGDTQVTPGVLNRIFLKVLQPICPQRLHNLVAEIMWSPPRLPWKRKSDAEMGEDELPPQQQPRGGLDDIPKTGPTRVLKLIPPELPPEPPLSAAPSLLSMVTTTPDPPRDPALSESSHTLGVAEQVRPTGPTTPQPDAAGPDTTLPPPSPSEPVVVAEHAVPQQQSTMTTTSAAPALAAVVPQSLEAPPQLQEQLSTPPPSANDSQQTSHEEQQPARPTPPAGGAIPDQAPEVEKSDIVQQSVAPKAIEKPTLEPSAHQESPTEKPNEAPGATGDPSLEYLMDRYQRERLSPWGDPMAPYLGG